MKDNDILFCGYSVIYDMIRVFETKCHFVMKSLIRFAILFSICRAITPIAYNFWERNTQAYQYWSEYYIAFASAY